MKLISLAALTEEETMPLTVFKTVFETSLQPCKRFVFPNRQKSWQLFKGTESHQLIFWPDSEKQHEFESLKNWRPLLIGNHTWSKYVLLSDYKTPKTKRKFWGNSKIKPKYLLMTSHWLSNSAKKPFNSSPIISDQLKVFFVRNGSPQKKKSGLVRKHTIPKSLQKFVQSVVQNVNWGHLRLLVKLVTTAKDPTIRQKGAVQRNYQTTLWSLSQRPMKGKKMQRITLFSFYLQVTWRRIQLENFKYGREVLMMRVNGVSFTLISTKFWQTLCEPKLQKMATGIKTYDH